MSILRRLFTSLERRRGLLLAGLATLTYALCFVPLFRALGNAAPMFSMLPLVLAGWYLGLRGATVVLVVIMVLNFVLRVTVLDIEPGAAFRVSAYWGGHLLGWAVAVDRLRQALDSLRTSREHLTGIVGATADAVIAIDDRRRITHFNSSAESIFGYPAGETIGQPLDILIPVGLMASHRQSMARMTAAPDVPSPDDCPPMVRARRRDGSEFPIEVSLGRFHVGDRPHFTAVVRDISQRIESTRALEHERNLLDLLMYHVPDFIFFKDRESRFIRVNDAVAELLGHANPGGVVGLTDFDHFDEATSRRTLADDRRLMQSGESMLNVEERVESERGHRWLLTSKIPTLDGNGEITGLVGISTDITRLKQTE